MNLKFKKPSKETQLAMSKVAIGEDNQDYHQLAEEKLANAIGHHYAKLLGSGNAAILSVMNSIDGAILIPDQGAWNGFKQMAKFLNKDIITVKTDHGLIDIDGLDQSISQSSDEGIIDLDDENYLVYKLEKECHMTISIPANEHTKKYYEEEMKRIDDAVLN